MSCTEVGFLSSVAFSMPVLGLNVFRLYMQFWGQLCATNFTIMSHIEVFLPLPFILLSHAVAFMRFSQSAYSQDENNSSLSVSLVLDPFGGSGNGSAAITQDIVEQIIAFAQEGDTATGN